MAGYPYATIYVKIVMIKDLVEFIQKKIELSVCNVNGIKKIFKTYIAYYLENSDIFKFFYFHQLSKPVKNPKDIETEPNYDDMWKETFKGFVFGFIPA